MMKAARAALAKISITRLMLMTMAKTTPRSEERAMVLPKMGHSAPDDEAPRRSCYRGEPDAGDERTHAAGHSAPIAISGTLERIST